jgi:glycine cleavage system H protein
MTSPTDRRYTKTHEWVLLNGDTATIGVTDFAQTELGDITYLELPEIGGSVSADEAFGVIESVKAASDVYSPIDGEVIERNEDALVAPESINQSPYGDAWLVRVKLADASQIERLMDSAAYDAYAETAGH